MKSDCSTWLITPAKRGHSRDIALGQSFFELPQISMRKDRDMTDKTQAEDFVIYSANEASISDGAGFWSNADGWVDCVQEADRFTAEDAKTLNLPMSTGNDAAWCKATQFSSPAD
jgi:hypothetical protein